MLIRLADFGYILATITLVVYGQLVFKWRLSQIGPLPDGLMHKVQYLALLVFDPYILSGYLAGFIASLAWLGALTRFDLNYAYPFMSLSFVLVLILSSYLLHEPFGFARALGVALIVVGTIVVSRS
jgi:uncharacterized membrane protein